MKNLVREPLLHFLLLGLCLFLLHDWMGTPGGAGERITITRGRIGQLASGFERMHQRAPGADEINDLIDAAIREEIFYREAKTLGLDRDDTLIRRRLMQKLEFVSEDVAPLPDPTEAQLQAYLLAHPERFRSEARYSLSQIYLDPQRRAGHLAGDVRALLANLQHAGAAADASKYGDTLQLAHRFQDVTASELTRLFGDRFEAALRGLPTNQWQGPVPSGYGVHIVFVAKREGDRPAALKQVRDVVYRTWIYDQRQKANERFYADLRKRYEVTVERPAGKAGSSSLASKMRQ
jgi:hypothetical protein